MVTGAVCVSPSCFLSPPHFTDFGKIIKVRETSYVEGDAGGRGINGEGVEMERAREGGSKPAR